MKFVNLTPHALHIALTSEPLWMEIPPSGTVARVSVSRTYLETIDGIPIFASIFGDITELPDPEPDTIYVVSALVQARTKRRDVYAPGELMRDADGQVVGCKGLTANPANFHPWKLSS